MSVEPIKDVISLWERNQITEEQVIGKLLLWFLTLYTEHLQVKAHLSRLEGRLARLEGRLDDAG